MDPTVPGAHGPTNSTQTLGSPVMRTNVSSGNAWEEKGKEEGGIICLCFQACMFVHTKAALIIFISYLFAQMQMSMASNPSMMMK